MPFIFLGQSVPIPSLRTYSLISCLLIILALYYSYDTAIEYRYQIQKVNKSNTAQTSSTNNQHDMPFVNQRWPIDDKNKSTASSSSSPQSISSLDNNFKTENNSGIILKGESIAVDMALVLLQEGWCTLIVINMSYCSLFLFGKLLQLIFFGKLRVSERQQIRETIMNFIFYKFIFVFGVLNVQRADDVILWIIWFSFLLFLRVFSQLCTERFEYLASSPTTCLRIHCKIYSFLTIIFLSSTVMIYLAYYVSWASNFNKFAFLVAEVLLLFCKSLLGLIKYSIHLYDTYKDGMWENRHSYNYSADFNLEMTALMIDFVHHLHMLIWGNVFLSMASLVIFMQLRYLFTELLKRWYRHKNYMRVVTKIDSKFTLITDMNENDSQCAICWDKMDAARKLPCGHLFHRTCLGLWLEQDTSCPTCRTSIMDLSDGQAENSNIQHRHHHHHQQLNRHANLFNIADVNGNHAFRFDGSRYFSWLPSLSVEVTHTTLTTAHQNGTSTDRQTNRNRLVNSHLQNMARQVMNIFPESDMNLILDDLNTTHSVEVTIENILEGRLIVNVMASVNEPVNNNIEDENGSTSDGDTDNDSESEVYDNDDDYYVNSTNDTLDEFEENGRLSYHDIDPTSGQRFSKSAKERQDILKRNKRDMVEKARRQFIEKQQPKAENILRKR